MQRRAPIVRAADRARLGPVDAGEPLGFLARAPEIFAEDAVDDAEDLRPRRGKGGLVECQGGRLIGIRATNALHEVTTE
jgi:hypothetical protein